MCSAVHSKNIIAAVRNFCTNALAARARTVAILGEGRLRSVKANLMLVQGCRGRIGIYFNFMARNGYYYSLIFPGVGKAYLVSYFL